MSWNVVGYRDYLGKKPSYDMSGSWERTRAQYDGIESIPPATFKRLCNERIALVNDVVRQEMLLKLRYGEIPFSVNPDDYDSVDVMRERHDLTRSEIYDHFEFLNATGIVDFYSTKRISNSFFPETTQLRGQIRPFATIDPLFRNTFYDKPDLRDQYIDYIIRQKRIFFQSRQSSPGVSNWESH